MPAFDTRIIREAGEGDGFERSGSDWQDSAVAKQLWRSNEVVEGFRSLRSLHTLAMICRPTGYPLGLKVSQKEKLADG